MCLTVSMIAKEYIAQEDIPCYKVLLEQESGRLIPPIANRMYHVPLDWAYTLGEVKETDLVRRSGYETKIYKGFHSLRDKVHLKQYEYIIKKYIPDADHYLFNYKVGLYECVIPKGSRYYIGHWDTGDVSFASSHITIVRRVEEYPVYESLVTPERAVL